MKKKELLEKIKELYPYYKNLQKMSIAELQEIYDKDCDNFLLKNDYNSCYMDSLFTALFHDKNKNIYNLFFKSQLQNFKDIKLNKLASDIREELLKIYITIFDEKNKETMICKNLRKLFHNFSKLYNINHDLKWKTEQLEPIDVINILSNIFIFKKNTKINVKRYGSNKKTKTINYKNITLLSDKTFLKDFSSIISIDNLLSSDKVEIKSLFPKTVEDTIFDADNLWKPHSSSFKKDDTYLRKIEKITYLSSKFLFIHVNRVLKLGGRNYQKIKTPVIPALKIKLKENDSNLYLKSIIIHHGEFGGGHYTTLFVCKGVWYEFDDLTSKIRLVGTFEDLCKNNNGYNLENCTNILYY